MLKDIQLQERTIRGLTKNSRSGLLMKLRAAAMLCVAVGRRDLNVFAAGPKKSLGQRVEGIFTVDSVRVK